jgi:hypothetical protein
MVKNNESKVEITNRNIKYYTDRNYTCKVGDIISIDIDTMPKNSHNKVIAICEKCEKEKELEFSKYNRNKDRQGFYSCKGCSNLKRKRTVKEKYGVENITQTDFMRETNRKWMSSDEFKNKSKESVKEIYGVDHYSKTDEFKKDISLKIKESVKQKKEQGIYECALTRDGNREKRDKGMIDKYGATYSFQVPEIKKKIQDKNLTNFRHISPFGNKDIQNKSKATLNEKYGVDNPFKNKEIQDKIRNLNENKFKIDRKSYNDYKTRAIYLTYSIKDKLFENWDGYDYYDGEYIMEYLSLHWNNKNYPTIDHKKSCIYGYLNNIPVEEIANIDNLCITKRIINSTKGKMNENEFKK